MTMKDFLMQLLTSLEQVEVKGKHNMDILLGCMMAIERAIEQMNESKEEQDG